MFVKNDTNKAPLYHLSFHTPLLAEVCHILEHGAEKYGNHNWKKGCRWSRYVSAMFRHLFAWVSGERNDSDTGKSHLAHAICNIMFLFHFQDNGIGIDDLNGKESKPATADNDWIEWNTSLPHPSSLQRVDIKLRDGTVFGSTAMALKWDAHIIAYRLTKSEK